MSIKGYARVGKRTKELVKYLKPNEIAIIAHEDVDQLAAYALTERKVKAVINAYSSISGQYPHRGPEILVSSGIYVLDQVGEKVFNKIRTGMEIELLNNEIFNNGNFIGKGEILSQEKIEKKFQEAKNNYGIQLERFIQNTIEYAAKELDLIGKFLEIPPLFVDFKGRHSLIVVRGNNYKEDLSVIRSYIDEVKPVIIGVDGGADALYHLGHRPHIIIGDMDSISDETLKCGAQLIVHAYPDGRAPGMERIRDLGLKASILPAPGTSEDVAMLLAYQMGTELIVAVGTHSNVIDFLEKGRPGMASTFLVRLKVGSILVDAKGVSKLYRQNLKVRYIAQIIIAALIPFIVINFISPSGYRFFRLLSMKLRILFQL
ncbi:MAG: putative cytokinetic ring protein SteA [Bacillota bacterium]